MGFEWQTLDQAAATLEVNTDTLQQWINEQRAPSRERNGSVEVLIEFPDDDDTADTDSPQSPEPASSEASDPGVSDAEFEAETDSSDDADPEDRAGSLEVTHQRELQLAGGMVAAWKRLADTSDHELHRSRKLGILAWSCVVLLLAGCVTIAIWATRAESDTDLVKNQLDSAKGQSSDRGLTITDLRAQITKLNATVADLNTQLRQALNRATTAEQNAQKLSELNKQLNQASTLQQQRHEREVARLELILSQNKTRIENLEKDIDAARKEVQTVNASLATSRKQFNSVNQQLIDERKDTANLRSKLDTTESNLREARKTIAEQAKTIRSLRESAAKSAGHIESSDDRFKKLQSERDNAIKQRDEAVKENKSLNDRIKSLEKQLKEAQEKLKNNPPTS